MKRESHRMLGVYLLEQITWELSAWRRRAFLLGCIEPDSNPFTYLKGSRRVQMLRGHNYRNAERWMDRMAARLEARQCWRLLDYYRLGQLIHYTSDAFTFAHNETFRESIREHRRYEQRLQRIFQLTLALPGEEMAADEGGSAMEAIRTTHERYMRDGRTMQTDVDYILAMTRQIFCRLVPEAV